MRFPTGSTNFFFKKASLLFASLLLYVISFAQKIEKNLVPNPGLEKHRNKSSVIKNAKPWKGQGTVDYYMKTDKHDTSRFKGAHSGTCYAGLRFQPNYKEYMYVKLTKPLERGKTYNFKMYVRLMGVSTVTIKQLGVYFSERSFKVGMNFDSEGILDSTYIKGISGTLDWIPIQGKYKAHGREKFIIVGNFRTKMKDDFVRVKKWGIFERREAYYYIDDISVYEETAAANLSSKNQPDNFQQKNKELFIFPDTFTSGQIIEIKNIQFENGTARLLKPSFKILDEVVNVLNQHPFMEIQINGHSDNQGKEVSNRRLSKKRSKAVYEYLLQQSIINPIEYKGFGSSQPVVPNDTDENKGKNRRVELMIIKNE